VLHLYSGRTLCKMLLPPPGLHADVNGDGVVDHIEAHGGGGDGMASVGLWIMFPIASTLLIIVYQCRVHPPCPCHCLPSQFTSVCTCMYRVTLLDASKNWILYGASRGRGY